MSNSLATHKLSSGTSEYNKRVAVCRLAAAILGKRMNVKGWEQKSTLKELQDKLGYSLSQMIELVKKHLREKPYTMKELIEELGMDVCNT